MLRPPAGIKIETSPSFDRNWYRVQPILHFLLAATVLAGLAGVFGGGWLSSDVVRIGGMEVTYDRFARKTVPFRIVVRAIDPIPSGPIEVTIGRELAEKAAIIRTIPTATATKEVSDGTGFSLTSENPRPHITISVQPDRFGVFTWKLKIVGAGDASLFQIIYP